jgi:hypothetical protein
MDETNITTLERVGVNRKSLENYRPIVGEGLIDEIRLLAASRRSWWRKDFVGSPAIRPSFTRPSPGTTAAIMPGGLFATGLEAEKSIGLAYPLSNPAGRIYTGLQ